MVKAIIAAYKNGIKKVCEVYDISRSSLHRWVRLFKARGIEGIKNANKPPRSKLNKTQEAIVKEWLEEDANVTIKKLKIRIEEEFQTGIGKSSVHRLILKLGFSHITGRKRHYKSDPSAQAEFKKKI